ncbi:MAG: flagellar biosynthesis protein FlhB [Alphaproteobacteria bacterium]|nr:flagellar biosynthesis protein FlhB [Alphaproteobacteria bacterium]
MAEESEDKESKTEQPSERRIEESFEKGNVAYSREVTSFMMLLSLALISYFILPFTSQKIGLSLKVLIEQAATTQLTEEGFGLIMIQYFNKVIFFSMPIFICIITIIIFSNLIQLGRFIFAPEKLMPDWGRISLSSGLQRLFSLKSFMEFAKGLVKIIITAVIIYFIVMSDIKALSLYSSMPPHVTIKYLFKIINDILISICVLMFVVAVADFFYQQYEYIKGLMMSRHEIKEEYRQTEGNPDVKRKQKQLMQSSARRRMLSRIPEADVIITNPEHYSIALKYEQGKMLAPIIIAKGLDLLALKIREIAKENDVPIVENPPLARALYLVDLEHPIPVEHYETVAEIISYVYRLKKKKI